MRFVLVPAGEFFMGSDETPESLAQIYLHYEPRRFVPLRDEAPVHRVRITRPFYLGQYEVTVGQFRRFLDASGNVPESIADGTGDYGYNAEYNPAGSARGNAFEGRDPKYSWRDPGFAQGDDHPVLNVTWNDAVALAKWLTAREGVTYRLPTEAEWEYACRAGTRTRCAMATTRKLCSRSRTRSTPTQKNTGHAGKRTHSAGAMGAFTAPIGSFMPNAWALYDMHGNAWEWVSDWHADDYAQSPVDDPRGPATGGKRVRRGGSWHTWALYARCAYRNWNTPDTRYTLVGIRLLREVEPTVIER